jgi:hypothetical protein
MRKEIHYEDYRIGHDVYTVKLTRLPKGGINYNPAVRVQVMEWHLPPRNLWERITEWWKYSISEYVWDPLLTEASLNAYCIDKCNAETLKRIAIEKGETEWVW